MLPVLIGLLFVPGAAAAWAALFLYILSSVTDFFDGWLARKYEVVSGFGTFLDPISDKVFVAALLVALTAIDRLDGVWILPTLIILAREFLVSGMREFLGPKNIKLPVSAAAKWKTTLQMIALGFLVIGPYGDIIIPHTTLIGQITLSVAAILTIWTGWIYLRTGARYF